jgi:hypothetical protein
MVQTWRCAVVVATLAFAPVAEANHWNPPPWWQDAADRYVVAYGGNCTPIKSQEEGQATFVQSEDCYADPDEPSRRSTSGCGGATYHNGSSMSETYQCRIFGPAGGCSRTSKATGWTLNQQIGKPETSEFAAIDDCLTAGLSAPTPGRTVNVYSVADKVLVKAPPAGGFRSLGRGDQVPVGATVDATRGSVLITAAAAAGGATMNGEFSDGLFIVRQKSAARPVTDVVLRGKPRCSSGPWQLVSNVDGRFRVVGRHSAATASAASWLTKDTCDGTITKVTSGKVRVRDFAKRRTVTVSAGHRYNARRKGPMTAAV